MDRKIQTITNINDLKGGFKKGHIPWNTNLTKETDKRLEKMGNNLSELMKGKTWEEIYGVEQAKEMRRKRKMLCIGPKNNFYGHKHTQETKDQISKSKKGKKSEKKGKTYEEMYGEEISNNLKVKKARLRKDKTWEEIFGVELSIDMKKSASISQSRTWEERFGISGAKIAKKKLSDGMTGSKHFNWKGGSDMYPYGYNWTEQKNKILMMYKNKSAISGKKNNLHIHHIYPRRRFLQFIYNNEFFNDFFDYNKHLTRILFPYLIPDVLVDEMNNINHLIPLTNSEHQRHENESMNFFKKFIIKEGLNEHTII